MLDDLRDSANFTEDDSGDYAYEKSATSASSPSQFLGMNPVQRFVVAFMIFMMICILGSFFLLITETIWLPI